MQAISFKGEPVGDDASVVCVLFDPSDGRVVHVHGMTSLNGTRRLGEDELEQKAFENAKRLGHSTAGLKALHVPPSALRQRGLLRVEGTALVPVRPATSMMEMVAGRDRR
jgi:hypothetical protein